ncbi:Thiol-disulfide isomerase or thioredoxin [Mucilaginibacter gossypiicola]|uniref:Thiol-disulfide isomerase or thioredoxin n=1 Tax=Mucilaginibacter gossypiicola TaxID=551995 RepID=A0A1H8DEH5_9SPHI|nr:TlpA family protein disulfide reductase [Mucilaginibacter gossypiicola]SEN04938.1 Thiol-disulfide isomerase or thioredoxin [Mucilaginibacter gossypiicola]
MKLKIRFPAILWPFGKQQKSNKNTGNEVFESNTIPHPYAGAYMLGVIILVMLALLLFWQPACNAQARQQQGLKIGDQVPDVLISKLINYPTKSAKLSDFKGKLLILDFWATSCGACISSMPRLDSLQQQFKDRIVILPVTYEKAEKILAFQQSNKFLRGLKFPSVVEDTVLQKIFPHRMLPHDVWVDEQGKVIAFTEAWQITAETISKQLNGTKMTGVMKVDAMDYNSRTPLLVNHNGGNDSVFRYRSIITGYLKGLPSESSLKKDTLHQFIRIKSTNGNPRRLYTLAFKELQFLEKDQIINRAADHLAFDPTAVDSNMTSHFYCYELDLPGTSVLLARESIHQDLDRFFQVRTTMVEKDTMALILSPLSAINPVEEPATDIQISLDIKTTKIANLSPAAFIEWLKGSNSQLLLIDDSGKHFHISAAFQKAKIPLSEMNQTLKRSGVYLAYKKIKRKQFLIVPLPAEYNRPEPLTY